MRAVSIRINLGYFLIGFAGISIFVMALILESSGTESDGFDIFAYLSTQTRSEIWWTTFGVPYLAGLAFMTAAIAGPWVERATGVKWPLFLGCIVASVVLMLWIGGFGTFAFVATLIAALGAAIDAVREKRQRTVV